MKWSRSIRQAHRWLSLVFTALVVANVALNFVGTSEDLALTVGFATLVPLGLLLLSGLYLFVLPYAVRRWGGPEAGDVR